jgi:DNA-directed RNA polymerase specialized sigma24 family protein
MASGKKTGRQFRSATAPDAMESVQSTVDTVVRRMVGSRDPEYEDLVQSSLVNVLATIDRGNFRGDCPTGGWAAIIARNVAVDAIRARARERRVFAQEGWDEVVAGEKTRAEADLGPERLTDLHLTLDRVNWTA